MKTLIVLLFSLSFINTSFGADRRGVEQRMYSAFHAAYTTHLQAQPCVAGAQKCTLNIESAVCKRYRGCEVSFMTESGKIKNVKFSHRQSPFLHLYIIMRSGSSVADIIRFGRRYRPDFKLGSPLSCTHDLVANTYSCI